MWEHPLQRLASYALSLSTLAILFMRIYPNCCSLQFTVITSLSWDLRVQCFVGSFFLSLLCSVLGSALLFTRRVTGFCVMVSLGSIISLLGYVISASPECAFFPFNHSPCISTTSLVSAYFFCSFG